MAQAWATPLGRQGISGRDEPPAGAVELNSTSTLSGRDYPRIQILTIRDLLEEHRKPDLPAVRS